MMNDAARQERIRPSLLDRLTDDSPDQQVEVRDRRGLSSARLKESVLRDVSWLMNCTNLEADQDLSAFPLVRDSVLNFGVPEFTGLTRSAANTAELEDSVKEALLRFEPRIIPETLKVACKINRSTMSLHSLSFEFTADIRADPTPLPLFLRTQIDVEARDAIVTEQTR